MLPPEWSTRAFRESGHLVSRLPRGSLSNPAGLGTEGAEVGRSYPCPSLRILAVAQRINARRSRSSVVRGHLDEVPFRTCLVRRRLLVSPHTHGKQQTAEGGRSMANHQFELLALGLILSTLMASAAIRARIAAQSASESSRR